MGRQKHSYWEHFKEIIIPNKRSKAECLKCLKSFSRTDKEFLKNHSEKCNVINRTTTDNHRINTSENINPNTQSNDNNCYEGSIPTSISDTSKETQQVEDIDLSATCTQSSDSDTSRASESNICNLDKRIFLMLKVCIMHGIDTNIIQSAEWRDMIKSFDQDYILPSQSNFDSIIEKAITHSFKKQYSKSTTKIVSVTTSEQDKYFYAISMLLCKDSKPIYLNFVKVLKHSETDLKDCLMNFCKKSAEIAHTAFKVTVKFLIYESKFTLDEPCQSDTQTYTMFQGMNSTIDKVRSTQVSVFQVDLPLLLDYYRKLGELRDCIVKTNVAMHEATENLFSILADHAIFKKHSSYEDKLAGEIFNNMHPLCLVTNYFNPIYHGHYFENKSELFEKCQAVIRKTAPNASFPAVAYYIKKDGPFLDMYRKKEHENIVRFWNSYKMYNEAIGEYALDILSIPSSSYKVDFNSIIDNFSRFPDERHGFRSFLFAILIGDNFD